jgi:hypothetical protein
MKKVILPALVFAISMTACKKNNTAPAVEVPAARFTYQSIDSMKLGAQVQNLSPQFYSDFNGKTYTVNSSKVSASYTEAAGGVLLIITDSSVAGYEADVHITFKNKTLNTLAGTYTLQGNNDVCVQMLQNLGRTPGGSSWAMSSGCETNKSGTIQISYDAATQTLNGEVKALQYPFGYYVPYYVAGNAHSLSEALFLHSSGSTRTQRIAFQYVRRK